jgi:hypothetical protein
MKSIFMKYRVFLGIFLVFPVSLYTCFMGEVANEKRTALDNFFVTVGL